MNASVPIPILTGPTASGKTALALDFAQAHGDIEIVNADSLLVYRGFDIGTAKPSPGERARVPHHGIDIRDPDEPYTAADFVRDTEAALRDVLARGGRPLIVGGTGFYLKALLFGLWEAPPTDEAFRATLASASNTELHARLAAQDAEAAHKIGLGDRYRLVRALEILAQGGLGPSAQESKARTADPRFKLLWADRPTEELHARIRDRTRTMLDAGLEQETADLHAQWPDARALTSVGYAQVRDTQEGRLPEGRKLAPGRAGLASEIDLATRQLVKAQRTWFKGQFLARAPQACSVFTLDADRGKLLQTLEELLA